MRELEINHNYGGCFGLRAGQAIIYRGGNTWELQEGDRRKTIESPDTTAKALAYLNQGGGSIDPHAHAAR